MGSTRTERHALCVLLLAIVIVAAGCGNSSKVDTGTTETAPNTTKGAEGPKYLSFDKGAQTATLTLKAGDGARVGGFNFNGYGNGDMVVSVPTGWKVTVKVSNASDTMPHSAVIATNAARTARSGIAPAFAGAATDNPVQGIDPGGKQDFSFTTGAAGTYTIVCAVPGHNQLGMWDVFKVTTGGTPAIDTPTETNTPD